MGLKELLIVVRPEKSLATEETLLSGGALYVTRHTVSGRGKEMGLTFKRTWFGFKTNSYSYLRKAMLSAIVEEKNLKNLLHKIIQKNRTGQYGDGRIFVLPCTR